MASPRLFLLFICVALLHCASSLAARPAFRPARSVGLTRNCTTNAECLSTGQRPLPPSRTRRSRRDVVPAVSQMASTYSNQFRIAVYNGATRQGWLSNTSPGAYLQQVVTDQSKAVVLATNFPEGETSSGPLNFRFVNPPSPGFQWFIMQASSSNAGSISPAVADRHSAAPLAGNQQTTPNSRPITTAMYWNYAQSRSFQAQNYESAVWYMGSDDEIIAKWTNANPALYGPETSLQVVWFYNSYLTWLGNAESYGANAVPRILKMERF